MIELNCSYEESKKILELGYDFGKKFGDVYKKRDCPDKYILVEYHKMKAQEHIRVPEEYFNTDVEKFTLERLSRDYEDSLYSGKHIKHFEQGEIFCNPNKEGFVPIIPKDALQKCLPDLEEEKSIVNARVWLGKDLYAVQEGCTYSSNSGLYDLERLKDQEFNSAYEAFIWCHEHYREELKKKFEEVTK